MAYARTKRIGEEIKKIISSMITMGEIKDFRVGSGGLVSILEVDVTSDLKYAYIYTSVLGKDEDVVIQGLNNASGYIRKEVGRKINLRYTPEMIFKKDESIERGVYMSKLIKDINGDNGEE